MSRPFDTSPLFKKGGDLEVVRGPGVFEKSRAEKHRLGRENDSKKV